MSKADSTIDAPSPATDDSTRELAAQLQSLKRRLAELRREWVQAEALQVSVLRQHLKSAAEEAARRHADDARRLRLALESNTDPRSTASMLRTLAAESGACMANPAVAWTAAALLRRMWHSQSADVLKQLRKSLAGVSIRIAKEAVREVGGTGSRQGSSHAGTTGVGDGGPRAKAGESAFEE